MKCKTKDCKLEVGSLLSTSDSLIPKVNKDGTVTFHRVSKYRCPNGHLNEVDSVVTVVIEKDKSKKALSVKRFHMKGFSGHKNLTLYEQREATMIRKYGGKDGLKKMRQQWGAKANHSPGGKSTPNNFKNNPEFASRAGQISKRPKRDDSLTNNQRMKLNQQIRETKVGHPEGKRKKAHNPVRRENV
jgi:general stress protein YciG